MRRHQHKVQPLLDVLSLAGIPLLSFWAARCGVLWAAGKLERQIFHLAGRD